MELSPAFIYTQFSKKNSRIYSKNGRKKMLAKIGDKLKSAEKQNYSPQDMVCIGAHGLAWRFLPNDIPGLKNMLPIFVPIADSKKMQGN